ncbi:MAG: acetate--CoA ligase [Pseudomonadota bacterium]
MTFKISSKEQYNEAYQASIQDPQKFWAEIADNFFWFEKWQKTMNCDLSKAQISWFENGKTNISYNCLDRHLEKLGDKIAIIWESNDPNVESQKITYQELYEQTCQFANLLLARGIKKGDRVCIYMPMIPQGTIAMLACARIGAVHSVVFAGFSAQALAGRIQDCGAKMLITSDLLFRGDKKIELFEIAKEALAECANVESVIVYKRSSKEIFGAKIVIWQDEIKKHKSENKVEIIDSEDPLFILYTSGSTGKPKGILHTVAGYMVYAGYSFQNVFQYQQDDVYFSSADIGWITGHTYLVYGPFLNGATSLMFEGIPTYPTASRFWEVIKKHQVNIFYTAPTAIRSLMQKGDEFVEGQDLSSLKTLGSVGEPINEEAWQWFFEKVGNKKCPIVDTWWQTETGGILISTMAGVTESKPSYAGFPLPGIAPILFDDSGKEITQKNQSGNLCFSQAWPGMARGVWGDDEKFFKTYYEQFPGYYFSGDGAFVDENGLYRISGRTDDVIKVSGHRLGTAEIENAINSHENVSESAVIGVPHDIKGEVIYAFVITKNGAKNIENEIISLIQKQIGSIAKPEKIFFVADLPKTRSGKIMRRILKKIVAGEKDLGDVATLVNPEVVEQLKKLQ